MGRILLLALPALAGCDVLIEECVSACWNWTFVPEHGIELKNAGTEDVRLTVVYDYWEEGDEVEDGPDEPDRLETVTDVNHLRANEKVTVWYPDEGLDVKVERVRDGQVLFQDYIRGREFEKEHYRVEITVYP